MGKLLRAHGRISIAQKQREQLAYEMRNGGATLSRIGAAIGGVSRERARQILKSHLRNNPKIRINEAAPDLLSALKAIVAEWDNAFGSVCNYPPKSIRDAKEAISKAEGH